MSDLTQQLLCLESYGLVTDGMDPTEIRLHYDAIMLEQARLLPAEPVQSSRVLRAEQDKAFLAALEADRAKELAHEAAEKAREAEEKAREAEEKAQKPTERAARAAMFYEAHRRRLAATSSPTGDSNAGQTRLVGG
jgi:hypothetical protein